MPRQVVPHIVPLVKTLQSDGLPNSEAFLLQFTELIHCMMYQYSGFPDLYDSILKVIKVRNPDLHPFVDVSEVNDTNPDTNRT